LNINTPEEFARLEKGCPPGVKAVAFVSKSGTGKTTLLEKIIPG
jgi:Ni2+-binding GTPase involved in maturation of urease and hydrogenase